MGFKPWGNLSVLLLAGAALVGCNNTPQKDKSLGAGPKIGDASFAKGQTNIPGPKFPANTNAAPQPYPQGVANPNPVLDVSPKSPWSATSSNRVTPTNPSFTPTGGPDIGGTTKSPLPPYPSFPSAPRDNAPLGGNGGGLPGNVTPPQNPFSPIPNGNSPFGGTINNSSAPHQPATPFATEPRNPNPQILLPGGSGIPAPQDFPKN
jgi:hypothetical protein